MRVRSRPFSLLPDEEPHPYLSLVAFLVFAHRAFIAADIAALPLALIFLFFGFVTSGLVDLGRPGPFFVDTFDSNALACCNLNISASISAMMRFVSMNPPLDQHKRRTIAK